MDYKAEAVYKMQNFIRKNITEEITLTALSAACGYSPWYSYRLFLQYTGFSPSDYIRKLRLSVSALKKAALVLGFLEIGAPKQFKSEPLISFI